MLSFRRFTRTARAGAALALSCVALVPAVAAEATPRAHTVTPSSTVGGKCHDEGASSWTISSISHKKTLTHVEGWAIPPGVSSSRTKSVERVAVLTAAVSTSTSASAGIQAKVLGKVEAKVDVNLAATGSVTKKSSESVTWTVPASKKDRYYVLFSGRINWTGAWGYSICRSDYWRHDGGKWRSFQSKSSGGALCKEGTKTRKSAYATTSLQYKACESVDWGN